MAVLAGRAPANQDAYRAIGTADYCDAIIIQGHNHQGASASAASGTQVILYDPDVLATLPYLTEFVFAHECAHHVLQHTTPEGMLREGDWFAFKELAADCWAATALAKNGEIAIVLEQMAIFRGLAGQRPSPRHALYTERADRMSVCLLSG